MTFVALANLAVSKPLHEMAKVRRKTFHVMFIEHRNALDLPNVELVIIASKIEEDNLVIGNGAIQVVMKIVVEHGETLNPLAVEGSIEIEDCFLLFLERTSVKDAFLVGAHSLVVVPVG